MRSSWPRLRSTSSTTCQASGRRWSKRSCSQSLGIAGGLSPQKVREQHEIIQRLNEKYAPLRVLHGSEVNIRADGTLDYDEETLRLFDMVTVSIHSGFGQSSERITARVVAALGHPSVWILNHPPGRLIEKRSGYAVDLDEVLKVAARMGTAVEINSQPDRLDLNDIWARRAKELGVLLSIDSDAHATDHLGFMRYGLAVARRGWLEKKNVLNALSAERLLSRFRKQEKAA